MNKDRSANAGLTKQPGGGAGFHIHTAVAHGSAKIVMPVSTMDTVAFIEEHGVRHIRQVITRSTHGVVVILGINLKTTGYCGKTAGSGGNGEGF